MASYVVYRPSTKRSKRVGYHADEFWNDRTKRWGGPRGASHLTEARARAVARAHGGRLDASAVAVDSPKRNPRRRNPSTSTSARTGGMLMGTLAELEVRFRDGSEVVIRPRDKLLGWIPSSRKLAILDSKKHGQASVPGGLERLHKQFHNADPKGAAVYEWPDPHGYLTDVGRLVALLYTIPPWLRSPQKTRYQWHHEFGDHGERGHGTATGRGNYPTTYMPMLQIDERGNLFIKRMPGNKFYVKDWLYW